MYKNNIKLEIWDINTTKRTFHDLSFAHTFVEKGSLCINVYLLSNGLTVKFYAMNEQSFKEKVQVYGLKKALNYVVADPEKNGANVIKWIRKTVNTDGFEAFVDGAETIFTDRNNNWHKYVKMLGEDIDEGFLKRFFETFIVNAGLVGMRQKEALRKEHDCNIPWAILFDPTSACNLHCKGCWAAEYGNRLNLTGEEWDSVIRQGKELGTYLFIYSGGEPLVRKREIIEMCEKHSDCIFLAFTNGTLIDEKFADDVLRVGNFIPAISVEGYREETDARRGEGCYDAVRRAMAILKERKLPFGVSCCYTRANTHIIGSERYFDDLIGWGAKFAWFFTYMPVGTDAVPELMVTPEQREFMYYQLRGFRRTKPLFTLDFWNDGEYVKGCIAGGRRYLHINANGDIEPCAFIHYSDSNIREKTILEALKSPLFMEYHKGQPFNENHLRPCPLLDNPGKLRSMVDNSGARSTDLQSPERVGDLAAKCEPAARKWAVTADNLWRCSRPEGCGDCRKVS